MASKQEDAPVEVPVVTEGLVSNIEVANDTKGDALMVTDEIIEVGANKKGTLVE